VLQQDQVSVVRGSGGAARLVQQHQPQQAHHLGFRNSPNFAPIDAISVFKQRNNNSVLYSERIGNPETIQKTGFEEARDQTVKAPGQLTRF
jgi:hypothetical protein